MSLRMRYITKYRISNVFRAITLAFLMLGSYLGTTPHIVRIPISIGELFDKITILEIKIRRVIDPQKLDNILTEWRELSAVLEKQIPANTTLDQLKQELLQVNEQLWNIEDAIRAKEAQHLFDAEFIELARTIYYANDRRGAIKRKINLLTCSQLVEEKEYTKY